jgi:hypothetical protein
MKQPTRYEIKMTCAEMHLPDVRAWVDLHPETFIEAYPPRRVNSLYFDTRETECLLDNLIGTGERQKLRLRWYGDDCSSVRGTLELKCKSNQLGWKVYHPLPITFDLTSTSWRAFMGQVKEHASGPFAVWLSQLDQPTLVCSYTRAYYESIDRQIRVTIDYDVAAYEQVTPLAPNLKIKAPVSPHVVVEVKAEPALHRRMSDVLSSFPIQVGRNSKYVNGVLGSLCFV